MYSGSLPPPGTGCAAYNPPGPCQHRRSRYHRWDYRGAGGTAARVRAGRAGPGFRNSTQQRRICPCPPQSWRVPRGSRCLPSTASCRPGGYGGRSIVARWGARRVVRYGCAHPSSRPVSVATRVGVASGLAPQTTRTPLTPRLLCGRGDQDPVRSGVHRHNSLGAGSYIVAARGGRPGGGSGGRRERQKCSKAPFCRVSVGSGCLTGQMRGPTFVYGSGAALRWLRMNRGVLPSTITGGGRREAGKKCCLFMGVTAVLLPVAMHPAEFARTCTCDSTKAGFARTVLHEGSFVRKTPCFFVQKILFSCWLLCYNPDTKF